MGLHAPRSKLADYSIILDVISVSSCAVFKNLGVIIDSSFSFDATSSLCLVTW